MEYNWNLFIHCDNEVVYPHHDTHQLQDKGEYNSNTIDKLDN